MKRLCRFNRLGAGRAFTLALGLWSVFPAVHASESGADNWREHTQLVLDLLMADTKRALEAHTAFRRGAPVSAPSSAPNLPNPPKARPSVPPRDKIRLVELFGAGDQLTAVVQVNGQRKEYRPGASLPYGGGGSSVEYRLLRIVDTCVLLQKRKGAVRTACYEPQTAVPVGGPSAVVSASRAPVTALSAPLPLTQLP